MNRIKQHFNKALILEILILNIILILGIFLRTYLFDVRPGYEWDEPVYANIASNYIDLGFPSIKPEGKTAYIPYLYHPPFDVKIKSIWFDLSSIRSVANARMISIFASIFLLLFIYHIFKQLTTKSVSLISLLFIATDGWLIYTNRLNLMENIMMLIGVLAIGMYAYALRNKNLLNYIFAGILIGATVVYKHTGIYFIAIPILYMFFTRRDYYKNLILCISALGVIIIYLLGMYVIWGDLYLQQTLVQVQRTLGIINSRGLNYSIYDAFNALKNTYWIYITTVITLVTGTLLVLKNTLSFIITKKEPTQPLLLSWSLASIIFLLGISLKAPQYLVIALLPLYVYLMIQLIPWIINKKNILTLFLILLIGVIINCETWHIRFIDHKDNALLETYNYVNFNLPHDAIMLTEESIGVGINQEYFRLDAHNTEQELKKTKPDYIITYISSTQKPPNSVSLKKLISQSRLLKEFKGFKEHIYIYKTSKI